MSFVTTASGLIYSGKKLVLNNLPTILTGVGVAGIGLTAFLAGRGSLKAEHLLEEKYGTTEDLGFVQKVKDTYVCYLPALGVGLASAACIIGAHKMDMAEIAKITAVATTAEKALVENREKVEEVFGEKGLRKVDEAINEAHASKYVTTDFKDVYDTGAGHVLCCEGYLTGRLFYADPPYIHRTVNKFNELLLDLHERRVDGHIYNVQPGECVNKFFMMLWPDLNPDRLPEIGNEIGFNMGVTGLVQIVCDSGLIEGTDTPYLIFTFKNPPISGYDDYDV